MKLYNEKDKNDKNKIIIKFLKDDADFLSYRLSEKNLREFQKLLKSIEKSVPKDNIEKLSTLKKKTQEPRFLIDTIFESNEDRYKQLLISNFENNLMSSSRASDKLIIFYKQKKSKFVIIHSKLKKFLYSHTKGKIDYIKIEQSLLDQKDFLRIIFFEKVNSNVYFKIKEISQSKFFDRWIGFKKLRKSYNKALTIELELGKEVFVYSPDLTEFYNKLQNNEIIIEDHQLVLTSQGEYSQDFKISSIEFEDNFYSTKADFKSFLNHFFLTQRYPELNLLVQEFHNFLDMLKETLIGWYAENPSNKIELFENDKLIYHLDKKELTFKKIKLEDINYIICSGEYVNCSIKPDKKFHEIIELEITKSIPFAKILHLNEIIKINNPTKINSIFLMNEINLSTSYELLENRINSLLESRRDSKLLDILRILKLCIFTNFLTNKFIRYFFENILNNLYVNIESSLYLDKELKILEFKSKKLIEEKSPNEIKSYFMDMAKKYCHFNFKLIIIGIEDKDKIDGVNEIYFSSDLIGNIQEELEIFLKPYNKKPFLQHIRIKEKQFLIVFVIY